LVVFHIHKALHRTLVLLLLPLGESIVTNSTEVAGIELAPAPAHIDQRFPHDFLVARVALVSNQRHELIRMRILVESGKMVVPEKNTNLARPNGFLHVPDPIVSQLSWPLSEKVLDCVYVREQLLLLSI
jgi:hypothetical protein